MHVYIDGNIGAGKSTALELLEKYGNKVFVEPINEWLPFLKDMYNGNTNAFFEFQIKVWFDRCLTHESDNDGKYILIHERSPEFQQFAFLKTLIEEEKLTERQYTLLHSMYEEVYNRYKQENKLFIYLRAEPNVCLSRIKQRNRESEDKIDEKYIRKLHYAHEEAFEAIKKRGNRVVSIDTSFLTREEICSAIAEILIEY